MLFLNFLLPVTTAFVTLDKEWHTYFETLQTKDTNLNDKAQFAEFTGKAQVAYPSSDFFKAENLTDFVTLTFRAVAEGKEVPGLAYATHICKYFYLWEPYKRATTELFKISSSHTLTADQVNTLTEIYVNAGFQFLPYMKPTGNPTPEESQKRQILTDVTQFVNQHSSCEVQKMDQDLSVRNMAMFFADGAVQGEVDLSGLKLEGQYSDLAACSIAQFLHATSEKHSKYIDKKETDAISKKLVKLSALYRMVRALGGTPRALETFEDVTIQMLRELEVQDDLLLAIGFTIHSMALSVKKVGPRLFDIYVFNSGAGINYHSSVLKGKKEKVFPAVLYKNVPLSKLKSTRLFQKFAELFGIAHFMFDNIEVEAISTGSSAIYEAILGCLAEFQYHYSFEDISRYVLITPQRSGTCSFRCILAYIASRSLGHYRLLKLFMSRVILDSASAKQWSNEDRIILARFLKFGIENYGRSLVKFLKEENLNKIPMSEFWDDRIISQYKQYSTPYAIGRPGVFQVETANAVKSPAYFEEILEKGKSVARLFDSFEQSGANLSIVETDECLEYRQKLLQPFSVEQIDALHAYASKCLASGNDFSLSLLLSTVLYHWPKPSMGDDPYDTLFPLDDYAVCEKNMLSMFRIVQLILRLSIIHDRGEYTMLAAHVKIWAIYQKAFTRIAPDMKSVRLPMTMTHNMEELFTCPDAGALSIINEILEEFTVDEASTGFNVFINELIEDSPLFAYIESLHKRVDWAIYKDYQRLETQLSAIFHMQLETNKDCLIPPHHYFWRIMMKIISNSEDKKVSRPKKFLDLPQDYNPLKEKCSLFFERLYCEASVRTRNEFKGGFSVLHLYPLTGKVSGYFKSSRTPSPERELKRLERYGICDTELVAYMNTIDLDIKDQLRAYIYLVQDVGSSFNWATLMYLGLEVINQASAKERDQLRYLLNILQGQYQKLLTQVRKSKIELETDDIPQPGLLLSVRQLAGSLVIQAVLAEKLKINGAAQALRREIASIIDVKKINGTYGLHLMLAYIISIQRGVISLDEAKEVVKYNIKLGGLESMLNEAIDKTFYLFSVKIVVNRALYILEAAYHKEPSSLKNLLDMNPEDIRQISFPWIETNSDMKINLLTGSMFIRNYSAKSVTREILEDLKTKSLIQYLPNLDFESITRQGKENEFLTIARIRMDLAPTIQTEIEAKVFLTELHYLASAGAVHLRICLSNGLRMFLVNPASIDYANLPLPSPRDAVKKYNLFANSSKNIALAYDSEETIWIDEAGLRTIANNINSLQRLSHTKEFAASAFLTPLSKYDEVELHTDSQSYYLNLKEYSDMDYKSLWFQLDRSGRWVFNNEKKYYADPDQTFKGCADLINYLVIKTETGQRKILLPIKHFEVEKIDTKDLPKLVAEEADNLADFKKKTYQYEFSRKNKGSKKRCLQISLASNGAVRPQSRLETILLAYHYLIARRYTLSFNMLRRVHNMEEFGSEELRLLAWMMFSFTANKDGSPDSVAVRSYVSYIVLNNNLLYGYLPTSTGNMSPKDDLPDPYSPSELWPKFWARELKGELIYRTVDRYFLLIKKIPVTLRFDMKSGRDIITPYKESVWLKNLFGRNIDIYLGTSSSRPQAHSISRVASLPKLSIEDIKSASLEGSYSAVHSFEFSQKIFPKLFFSLLTKPSKEDDLIGWAGYLKGLENNCCGKQAYVLREALFLRKYALEIIAELRSSKVDRVSLSSIGILTEKFSPVPFKAAENFVLDAENIDEELKKLDDSIVLKTEKYSETDLGFPYSLTDIKFYAKNFPFSELHMQGDSMISFLTRFVDAYKEKIDEIELSIGEIINGSKTREWTPERVAWGFLDYDRETLFHLYSHSSLARYKQYFPDFDRASCQKLHDLISLLALAVTNLNDLKRLKRAYKRKDVDPANYQIELEERMRHSNTNNNVIMAYEVFINSRLTEQQVKDILKLTTPQENNYANYLIQRIMSAGKTYILGTILAFMKADKHHLSTLIVPKSLYTRESANLIARTMNAFGSEGFSFKISNNDSKETVNSLKWIAETLESAISRGEYVILPPEALLSIQNKLFNYALYNKSGLDQLKRILAVFKDYGAATFDEIDLIFNPTQEVNSPLSREINTEEIEELSNQALLICELFNILSNEKITEHADVRRNVQILPENYKTVKYVLSKIASENLITKKLLLPVMAGLETLEDKDLSLIDKLREFLSADSLEIRQTVINYFESNLDATDYRLLCVARMFVTTWLPLAWEGNVNEHYGLSDSTRYAVPFSSAGTPKTGSEYSVRWLTYVRTIRTYIVSGFDETTIKGALIWLQKLCLKKIEEAGKSGESDWEKMLKELFDENPYSIDLKRSTSIGRYFKKAKDLHSNGQSSLYWKFLYNYLAQDVIPSIRYYQEQISSNSQDFTFMFDTIQGYSGTIYSTRTLPPYFLIKQNSDLDLGIEKTITDKIVSNSNFKVVSVESGLSATDFLKSPSIVSSMAIMKGHPFNAVIDVGAYFKDEPNESVAKALLKKQDGVFYFSTAKATKAKLSLISKDLNEKILPERVLESMSRESIEVAFKDTSKRVTFYDQSNTTGVDIYQDDNGYAIVILGLKTTSRDFFQAVMRMRKLLVNQRVVLVLPDIVERSLRKTLKISGEISVRDVIDFTVFNMASILKQYNLSALLHMIRAKFKGLVFNAIITQNAKFTKKDMLIAIKPSDIPVASLVSKQEPKELSNFMDEYIESCMEMVRPMLTNFERFKSEVEGLKKLAFGDQLEENYEKTLLASSSTNDSDQTVENEVEAQTHNLVELNMEVDDKNELFSHRFKGSCVPWAAQIFPGFDIHQDKYDPKDQTHPISSRDLDDRIFKVNDLLNLMPVKAIGRELELKKFFSDGLYVSQTFFYVQAVFGAYRPLVLNVLMLHKDDDYRAVIVKDDDVEKIQKVWESKGTIFGYSACIVDPTGTESLVRLGKFEANETNMRLLCEVLIYAGSTNILDDKKWTKYLYDWVNEDYHMRSAFYNHVVLSNAEGKKFNKSQLMLPLERNIEHIRYQNHDFMLLYVLNNKMNDLRKYFRLLSSGNLKDSKSFQKILEVGLVVQKIDPSKGQEFIKVALKTMKNFLSDENFLKSRMDSSKQKSLELAEKMIVASEHYIFKFFPRLNNCWLLWKENIPELCLSIVNRIAKYMEDLRPGADFRTAIQFLGALKTYEFWRTDPDDFMLIIPDSVFSMKHKLFDSKLTELISSITDENLRAAFLKRKYRKWFSLEYMVGPEFIRAILPRNPDAELLRIIFSTVSKSFYDSKELYGLEFAGQRLDKYEWFKMGDFLKYLFNDVYTVGKFVQLADILFMGNIPYEFQRLKSVPYHLWNSIDIKAETEAWASLAEIVKILYKVDIIMEN